MNISLSLLVTLAPIALTPMSNSNTQPTSAPVALEDQEIEVELALLDAVATSMGSARSWFKNEPEAALELCAARRELVSFAESRIEAHEDGTLLEHPRMQDRVAALKKGVKAMEEAVQSHLDSMPKQLATELDRHRKTLTRFESAKSQRVSSIAYVPKAVADTGSRITVYRSLVDTSSAVDTLAAHLRETQDQLELDLRKVLDGLDQDDLAKANRPPRDAYRGDDRAAIEAFARKSSTEKEVLAVVIPDSRWARTYGAVLGSSGELEIAERERLNIFVAVPDSGGRAVLQPVRIERDCFHVHGEMLGQTEPGEMKLIPPHAWPILTLSSYLD
jgi:hypothetical protein